MCIAGLYVEKKNFFAARALVDSSDDLIASWLMCRLLLMLMCVFE